MNELIDAKHQVIPEAKLGTDEEAGPHVTERTRRLEESMSKATKNLLNISDNNLGGNDE